MHIRHSYDREVVFVAFAVLILNPIRSFLEMNLMHLLSCLGSVAPHFPFLVHNVIEIQTIVTSKIWQ